MINAPSDLGEILCAFCARDADAQYVFIFNIPREREIGSRMSALRESIPTFPGTEYLKARLKPYRTSSWEFLTYLAYCSPESLAEAMENYRTYDGAENYFCIMEQMRERYIMQRLLAELEEETGGKIIAKVGPR